MDQGFRIYVAGHQGMVGSAIKRKLESEGYTNLVCKTHKELDLTDQQAVRAFFEQENLEAVFLAAAKVGGIKANEDYSADFIYENLMIECNVIHNSHVYGIKKLLFLGSSCIYPRLAPQPMKEQHLLTGLLEPTNEAYAIAKISGIKMCQMYRKQYGCDFISAMPTNLFGPNDNYHPVNSHVIPALIRRFHEAKVAGNQEVACWGTGKAKREFLYVDDLAEACFFLMNDYSGNDHINVGTGIDVTIKELAERIAKIVGYIGRIIWDTSRPDGTPVKLLDISKISQMGWQYKTELEEGLKLTYENFLKERTRS